MRLFDFRLIRFTIALLNECLAQDSVICRALAQSIKWLQWVGVEFETFCALRTLCSGAKALNQALGEKNVEKEIVSPGAL